MRRYTLVLAALLALLGQALAENFLYVADHNNGKVIKIKEDGTAGLGCPQWQRPRRAGAAQR